MSEPPPPISPSPPPLGGEPQPPAPPERGWTGGGAILGLALLVAAIVVEAAIVAAFDPEIESLAAKLTLQVLLAATMATVSLWVAYRGLGAWDEVLPALGLRRPEGPVVGPSLKAYFAYIGCALVIAALIQPEQEDVTRELGADEGVLGTVIAGLLIIGAAPLSEEIFFRGMMFSGLRKRSGFWIGAAVSSAIWGLFHYTGPDSWGVCLQLGLFGIALCWLYEKTGSIWPPIALHLFNNALAFTILVST